MQVPKWDDSLAIGPPPSVVKALKPREGGDIEVLIASERILKIRKKPAMMISLIA